MHENIKVERTLSSLGLLTSSQIKEAVELQRKTNERLGRILVKLNYLPNENVGKTLLSQLGLKIETIPNKEIPVEIIDKVPDWMATRMRVVPIKKQDDSLTVVIDDPLDYLALKNYEEALNCKLEGVLISEEELSLFLKKYYSQGAIFDLEGIEKEEELLTEKGLEKIQNATANEGPIIKLVSLIISEAIKVRASDIHLEPFAHELRVRFRVDGLLQEVLKLPKKMTGAVLSRVKIMASMDIAEKRLPQDGRITVNLPDNKKIDLRVSSLPGSYGESVVMRILDKSSLVLGLEHLGFLTQDRKKFEGLINIPHGIILVTGPTGSGKTTTLYTCLNYLNRPDKKIVTLEDPVEYELSGINHMQIQPKVGMTFASGLRAILRQAPNVVMVGEIRDSETAETAMRAALTGHLIFSTLHTNDAASAITRLIDIDISPYLIASTIEGIIAQRLVRVVCSDCREEYEPAKREFEELGVTGQEAWLSDVIKEKGATKFAKGKGCRKCMQTGYKGRLGIFEMLIMNDPLRRLIYTKAPTSVLKAKAIEFGMNTLRQDAIRKVFAGITTPSEVARVAGE